MECRRLTSPAATPAVAPYLASTGFYREWMACRLEGLDDEEALRRLGCAASRRMLRCMARVRLVPAAGNPPVELSVPVSGGASVLKKCEPGQWRLSMHGRWPAVHLGAISAAYGSMPYYPHLESGLTGIFTSVREGDPFAGFTIALHRLVADMLDIDAVLPLLRERLRDDGVRLGTIAAEKSATVHADTAFIDVIFRKGPEAIFTLLT